jgi:cell division protein FtsL
MEESVKNRIILILLVLTVIFLLGAVSSCNNARRLKVARDKEMITRLDLEEKMSKFTQEKSTVDNKLNTLNQALEGEKLAHQVTQKSLLQEQLISKSLTEELQKITKLKDKLEEDLKETLLLLEKTKIKK